MTCNNNCNCNKSKATSTTLSVPNPCSATPPANCNPVVNCCTGLSMPKFNVAKAQTVCVYVDQIYDSQVGSGTALFNTLQTTLPNYIVSTVLNSTNPACCQGCSIGAGAFFTINTCTSSNLLTLAPDPLTASQILINGVTIPNLVANPDGTYTVNVGLNNGIPSPSCELINAGTPSSLIIESAGPWNYTVQHDLYGCVNYNGQTCNFHVTVSNVTASTIPNNGTSTLMIPQLCIPASNSTVNLSLNGSISLISPVVVFDTITNSVQVTGTEVIVPQVTAEVLQPTKVCLQAMI